MTSLLIYLAVLVLKTWGALRYARRFPSPAAPTRALSVTICQPILSGDPDLKAALADTVQALPEANYLWLIDEDDAEAARVTGGLIERFPSRAIRVLVCPAAPEGVNPKLFKLEDALLSMPAGILLVLDDDTRLGRSGFEALVGALSAAELATGLPFYRDADTVAGNLLAQFVNNNAALTYLPLLNLAAPVSINGMCYALRTETSRALGGFSPLFRHLTDDLAVADAVREKGGCIVQTPFPQEVATTIPGFRQYVAQMHRWYVFALLLMRRRGMGLNLLMIAFYAVPPLLLWIGIVETLISGSVQTAVMLGATFFIRAIVLAGLQRHLTGRPRHKPGLSIASELLQPAHLLHAMTVKSIRWRTRRYRVYENDRFVSL
ncbi:MAG TPA: glycosyltransferase [Steroidobacteraceae bacterium]